MSSIRVLLPARSDGAVRLEDVATGAAVAVTLEGGRDVAPLMANGYLVYRRGHASGATVLHRASPAGVEDWLSFDERPATSEITYRLALGTGVAGLRLVENTLELLDASGAPRLRVEPPYLVGADGEQTAATLALEGCAVDRSPAPPWDRAVTAPGSATCELRVSWSNEDVAYPALLDPRWTATTNTMTASRQKHTATLLASGKVLVVGGSSGSAALATAELFDRTTGTWATTASLTGARQSHAAVLLGSTGNTTTSGKVLVTGGLNGTTSQSTAQLYDPTAGTWTAAANLPAGRHLHTATLLANGQVLIAGGLTGTATLMTAAIYNPASGTGTWTATGTMQAAVSNHTATLLSVPGNASLNNTVLVVGGNSGSATTAVVQVLSGTTWSSASLVTQLPAAREGHTATLLANGNVLITGGKSGATTMNTTTVFNPASGKGTWTASGNLTAARQQHTATLLSTSVLANGQVLVAGGSSGSASLSSTELWNGTSWTPATALPSAVQGHTATLLANGMVLVAGGVNGTATVNAAALYDPSWASTCTTNSQCATGFCVSGVCCDTACNGGCGSCNLTGKVGTCSPLPSTTTCRAANGACDVAEKCSGTALTCPTDAFSPSTTTCRAANGTCDVAEKCTGTSAACPTDAFLPSTTTCRASTGVCDPAETCTGTSAACPADALSPSTTVCRAANGACDVGEKCTGSSAACPADGFLPSTTVCRAANGTCDVAEKCTGSSGACPADGFLPSTTVCRAANGTCDVAESCTGSSAACPTDGFLPSSTTCRAANGVCDVAEKCTGSSGACPTDGFLTSSTTCRASTGPCDPAEACTGTSAACPADTLSPSTTVCRAANGACDVAEKCTGSSGACPADAFLSSSTVCRAANGTCDVAEKCTGSSGACPADAFLPSSTVCRTAIGVCDVAESCTGASAACPADGFAPSSTICRSATSQCDLSETCTGASPSCPADQFKQNGTLCDDSQKCTTNDQCTNGVCGGTALTCTAQDQCHLAGTCNPQTGACFNPEAPNGGTCDDGNPATTGEVCEAGACRPPAAFQQAAAFPPTDLGSLGGSITNPLAMNDLGQIVGNATTADGSTHAFVWNPPGPIQNLSAPLALLPGSIANDVNDFAVVVGTSVESSGVHHVFRYAWNGGLLPNAGAAGSSGAGGGSGSSGAGGGSGSSGSGGGSSGGAGSGVSAFQDLGVIGDEQPDQFGDRGSYAVAVNAEGDITGTFTANGDVQTFRYTAATGNIWNIGGLYGKQTIASDISDSGTIVGVSWVPNALTGGIRALGHGFINDAISPGEIDINQYVDPASGWTLVNARSISPDGTYIVGSGDRGGQLRGYRLNRTTGVLDELSTGWSGDVFPYSVNNSGQVVGTGFPTSSSVLTAWLYTDQSGFQRLDGVSPSSGWTFSVAVAINGSGSITGYGTYQGQTRAFSMNLGTSCPTACGTSDQCHVAGTCNPTTGTCSNPAKPNGTTCDDGNAATSDETCQVGQCRSPSSYPAVSNLEVDDIGELGGGSSNANAINSFGEVVGGSKAADGHGHAFDWQAPGPIIDVTAQGGFLTDSGASAVNDDETSCGGMSSGSEEHAYILDVDGVHDLGVGGDDSVAVDVFNYQGAGAYAMNASAQLTGWYTKQQVIHGFRYTNAVGFQDVPSLAGGETLGFAISDAGVVVGSSWVPGSAGGFTARRLGHGILWDGVSDSSIDLNTFVDPLMGLTIHDAGGISPNGRWIAGDAERNGILIAFRLDTTTGDIEEVSSGWPGDSYAGSVNDNGDVVGWGHPDAANQIQKAFIYTDQLGFKELNDIIDPASGWDLQVSNGVNVSGDIVGWGRFQNEFRGFRLHKVVTPAVACTGKNDGDACDAGNTCPSNNVCLGGVCGGGDPADGVCLSVDGVIDNGNGSFVAVFGYQNSTGDAVVPTVNSVSIDGSVVANPNPAPPPWLQTGYHAAAFAPAFSANQQISWQVNGQLVTASAASTTHLTKVPIGTSGGYGVYIGGTLVTIVPDVAPYAGAPGDPGAQPEPSLGTPFNGVLTGKFAVSANGAATYTVPISIPPGIAGMAPNLSLVYNSQGADGLAGQGWELGGLSAIYRCPKTRVQDGYAFPVTVGFIDNDTGFCLDGKRLFSQSDGSYKAEQEDFSKIRLSSDGQTFTIVTKTGETRYYGKTAQARVVLPPTDIQPPGSNDIVIWALDRVVDNWGNYFDVNYNQPGEEFWQVGIRVTSIDYTGHIASRQGDTDTLPFYSITFAYELVKGQGDTGRPDPRYVRFGEVQLPKTHRLSEIDTPAGSYALAYLPDSDPMLPSRLQSIQYCGPTSCMDAMQFGWEGGGYGWDNDGGLYDLPVSLRQAQGKFNGIEFADLNGDGLPDLIQAQDGQPSHAWRNLGNLWQDVPNWHLPANLADTSSKPKGTMLVDIDGDGKLDVVSDSPTLKASSPQIWLNQIPVDDVSAVGWVPNPGNWQLPSDWAAVAPIHFIPSNDTSVPIDTMMDIDGDGRSDIVRLIQAHTVFPPFGQKCCTTNVPADLLVLLNTPQGWQEAPQFTFSHTTLPGVATDYHFEDVNRDGLPDLVSKKVVAVNLGAPNENGTAWDNTSPNADFESYSDATPGDRVRGDIDGDGIYDVLVSSPMLSDPSVCSSGGGGAVYPTTIPEPNVTFSTGGGYTGNPVGYAAFMPPFLPAPFESQLLNFPSCDPAASNLAGPFMFNLADINGDGLADLVLGHPMPNQPMSALRSQGQLFINTGVGWQDLTGATAFTNFAPGSNPIPEAPTADPHWASGAAFVDLNGDGVPDLTGAEGGQKSYLNTFKRPVITSFPMGLAQPTQITYSMTTSPDAQYATFDALKTPVYSDNNPVVAGTRHLVMPLRVVSTVTAEDRTATGSTTKTTYHYESMRSDTAGRGPVGFLSTTSLDAASQVVTKTNYAQAYPYTGLPTAVYKSSNAPVQHNLISETHTTYCDQSLPNGATPTCTLITGAVSGVYPPATSPFVYAQSVTDDAYAWKNQVGNGSQGGYVSAHTLTAFVFDEVGNPRETSVTTTGMTTDQYTKTNDNTYGADGSLERQLGKVTQTVVTATGPNGSIVHTTAFDYDIVNSFYPNGGAASQGTLALIKTRVEPSSPYQGVEQHTAYAYDKFGNVTSSTSCASDFGQCLPGAVNSTADGTDPTNPQFRTTTVSYSVSDFNFPSNVGLGGTIYYGDGRFPVKTTDPAGHVEYTSYDPAKGVLLVKTDMNNRNTCHNYDDFGREVFLIDRCGGDNLATTYDRYRTTASDPALAKVVTIVHPPVGGATWVYTDVFGQKVSSRGRSFDGGFTESTLSYDPLGRVTSESKPYEIGSGAAYYTTPHYDGLNRLERVNQDLGAIDGLSANRTSLVQTTYDGPTVTTDELINGQHQTRSVTKNALGKESAILDANGQYVQYTYDADGNLTDTIDPAANDIHITYDVRGRKTASSDPDLGSWSYGYNGFGDLIGQYDANGLVTTMTYDQNGRMTTKSDYLGTSYWVYDRGQGGVGKLSAMIGPPSVFVNGSCEIPYAFSVPYLAGVDGGTRPVKQFTYTALGQPDTTYECVDGETFVTSYTYDHFGRQSQMTYPAVKGSRLTVNYAYTMLGFLQYLWDASDNGIYWAAKAMNASGQVTDEYTRNGVRTQAVVDDATGWLLGASSTSQANDNLLIQNWAYHFDEAGNLLWRGRSDAINQAPSEETFSYDSLNRLLTSTVAITGESYNEGDAYFYDALGNIQTKSGVGYHYTGCYAGQRQAGPHAVCSVDGGPSFGYDNNGNMITSSGGRSVQYNAANKVIKIQNASTTVTFGYGADGNRVVQQVGTNDSSPPSRTIYVGLGATGKSTYERTTVGNATQHTLFLYAAGIHSGNAFAIKTIADDGNGNETAATRYYHYDHLGSLTAMSDENGRVDLDAHGADAGIMGYTPWGERRNPDGSAANPSSFALPAGHRGFTGQESIPGLDLINMNGRIYDPSIGRFLTPDPNVQFAADLQSYNRYSYVLNNPLRYADPTGYFSGDTFMKVFFDVLGVAVAVVGIIACPESGGAGCALALAVFGVMMTATEMAIQGASLQQILITSVISLGFACIGMSGIMAGDGSLTSAIVTGVFSSMAEQTITDAALGEDLNAGSMLEGAAMAAAMSGFSYEYNTPQVSQASASGAAGNGENQAASKLASGAVQATPPSAAMSADVAEIQSDIDSARDFEALGLKTEGAEYRQMAIDKAIEVYGIETGLTKAIVYDPDMSSVGQFDQGVVKIGPQAFQDPGYLGSAIAHEAEVHGLQYFEGNLAMSGTSGRAMNESEAYSYEVTNADRFGLNPSEVREAMYYSQTFGDTAAKGGYEAQIASGSYRVRATQLYPASYYNQ